MNFEAVYKHVKFLNVWRVLNVSYIKLQNVIKAGCFSDRGSFNLLLLLLYLLLLYIIEKLKIVLCHFLL